MKAMERDLTTPSSERRPSARRMPNGREPATVTKENLEGYVRSPAGGSGVTEGDLT
jgi:hypothetical protein